MTVGAWVAASGSGVLVALIGRVRLRTAPRTARDLVAGPRWWTPVLEQARALVRGWARPAGGTGEPVSLLQLRTAVAHGASLNQAFTAVAGGGGDWAEGARRACSRVRAGAPLHDALDQWAAEDPDAAVALAADALAIASASGGSLVRAIDAVVDAVRERRQLHREVRALASQAQASAAVLVVMPVAFAAAVAGLDPRIRDFYLASAGGPLCLVAGAVLDGLGLWWMLRLVRRVG